MHAVCDLMLLGCVLLEIEIRSVRNQLHSWRLGVSLCEISEAEGEGQACCSILTPTKTIKTDKSRC